MKFPKSFSEWRKDEAGKIRYRIELCFAGDVKAFSEAIQKKLRETIEEYKMNDACGDNVRWERFRSRAELAKELLEDFFSEVEV